MRVTPTLSSIAVAALLAVATTGATAAAPLIDVQFSNDASHTQTGAAVIGHAGDEWNNFTTGQTGSGSLLAVTWYLASPAGMSSSRVLTAIPATICRARALVKSRPTTDWSDSTLPSGW